MGRHDTTYSILYSHPYLVESLLRGFLPAHWTGRFDFETLEPMSEAHGTEDWSKRYNDRIWRLCWRDGDGWVYFYLMLEFQRSDPPFMAVRVLSYAGVLYQHLIKSLRLRRGDPLPIVLPVVIYNGERSWRSETEIFDLITRVPPDMERFLPRLSYYLLDIRRLPAGQLASLDNAAACVFRVDSSLDFEQGLSALAELPRLLPEPGHESLRADIVRWILELVLPSRLTGVDLPKAAGLEEVVEMMIANAPDWTARWRLEGRKEGRQEGRREVLMQMLTRRFGPLIPALHRRIETADAEQILRWSERFVTARSLDEIFEDRE